MSMCGVRRQEGGFGQLALRRLLSAPDCASVSQPATSAALPGQIGLVSDTHTPVEPYTPVSKTSSPICPAQPRRRVRLNRGPSA
eukprot:scaffold28040_cov40-Phaeocystis_antarctica.AAC.2